MKKIDGFIGKAKKINSESIIDYELWVNNKGKLFVRFVKGANSKYGKFTDFLLFSVEEYEAKREQQEAINLLFGYNLKSNEKIESKNTNDSGFLKAVLRDLLSTN